MIRYPANKIYLLKNILSTSQPDSKQLLSSWTPATTGYASVVDLTLATPTVNTDTALATLLTTGT